jgi:hypothetical protein
MLPQAPANVAICDAMRGDLLAAACRRVRWAGKYDLANALV